MKRLLVGNGVIIQYGGVQYTNSHIIKRALKRIESNQHPNHLYPMECAEFIKVLHKEHSSVLSGEYDRFTAATFENSSLREYKNRYLSKHSVSVDQIGFEDYFLLFELVHYKSGVGNPDRFQSRAVLRRMFLDSIYNDSEIQRVHEKFPVGFVKYLSDYDLLFTTNYDSNLEKSTNQMVLHLHGAFDILGESYNPNSFRNQLSDDLLDGEVVDPKYLHLYSNCLISYTGELKDYSIREADLANNAMEKFAQAYTNDQKAKEEIDKWDQGNDLTRRLKEAIRLKSENPDLTHKQQYHSKKLLELSGKLEIVGLSPYNDSHLFKEILKNENLSEIIYHCFGKSEAKSARKLFQEKNVFTRDVRELWEQFD